MKTWAAILLIIILAVPTLRFAPLIRGAAYSLLRARELAATRALTSGWNKISSDSIEVRYKDDARVAEMVLRVAESHYSRVVLDFQYAPPEPVLVLVYDTREELRDAFGFSAKDDAAGVYWAGSIRVLSPTAWVGTDDPAVLEEQFSAEGPLAHEFTHMVLDYLTQGNYPRWFSEGLAQYEEYTVSGFVLTQPGSENAIYSFDDLSSRFETLSDQAVAYRQAFLLVNYMVGHYGWQPLVRTLHTLRLGQPFDTAIAATYGVSMANLEHDWYSWISAASLQTGGIWRSTMPNSRINIDPDVR